MRVLVTGATGFVGRAVVAALAKAGHDAVPMARRSGQLSGPVADVRDSDAVRAAVAGVDAVCHLAALTRTRESASAASDYWAVNVGGTFNVVSALLATASPATPKRLVLASTAAVYGTNVPQPVTEDSPTVPENPYGASKLAADHIVAGCTATGAIGAVALRAFNVAGAAHGASDQDNTRIVPRIVAVQAGIAPELTLNGDGMVVRDFVHVADMADAFVLALESCTPGKWRTYNVGSGRGTSLAKLVKIAEEVNGRPVRVKHGPPVDEPAVLLADSSRIRRELGWHPRRSAVETILADAWQALIRSCSG